MKILFASRAPFTYNRVCVLTTGLDRVAPDAYELHAIAAKEKASAARLRERARAADLVYVPPFRHRDVHFARANAEGRPVLFDPLIGNYLTRVEDYGWWWRRPFARYRDRKYFSAADHLVFDTEAHRRWTCDAYGFGGSEGSRERSLTHVLHIGADTEQWRPGPPKPPGAPLTVGFYGSLVPLQGFGTVLRAVLELQSDPALRFVLVGDHGTRPELADLRARLDPARVTLHDQLPYERLAEEVAGFDIALGVFGESRKADVVIPNKLYHYAAVGAAIVTREAEALTEVFTPGEDVVTVPAGRPEVLAKAVRELARGGGLRQNLGARARDLMERQYAAERVAQRFLDVCARVVGGAGHARTHLR